MLRALVIAFAVVAMTCASTSASADFQSRIYKLRLYTSNVTTEPSGGNPYPSCGPAAKDLLKGYANVVVRYGRTARVNSVEWNIVRRQPSITLRHTEPPPRSILQLDVDDSGSKHVRASLLYLGVNAAGETVCADGIGLGGRAVSA